MMVLPLVAVAAVVVAVVVWKVELVLNEVHIVAVPVVVPVEIVVSALLVVVDGNIVHTLWDHMSRVAVAVLVLSVEVVHWRIDLAFARNSPMSSCHMIEKWVASHWLPQQQQI